MKMRFCYYFVKVKAPYFLSLMKKVRRLRHHGQNWGEDKLELSPIPHSEDSKNNICANFNYLGKWIPITAEFYILVRSRFS